MMPAVRAAREADDDEFADPHGARGSRQAAGSAAGVRTGVPRTVVPTDTAGLLQGLRPVPGSDARADLAERLKRAWVGAGRPSMTEVGDEVGYSKASISKVLSGKMAPAWHLVRKLGAAFGVPPETIRGEWHELWIAADEYRRQPARDGAGRTAGRPCERCGCWVADPGRHEAWHAQFDPAAPQDRTAGPYRWAELRDALPRREE